MTGNPMKRKSDRVPELGRYKLLTASRPTSIDPSAVTSFGGFSSDYIATAPGDEYSHSQQVISNTIDTMWATGETRSAQPPPSSYRPTPLGGLPQMQLPTLPHSGRTSYGTVATGASAATHSQGMTPALNGTTLPTFAVGFGNLDPEGAPAELPSAYLIGPDDRRYWGVKEDDLCLNQAAATILTFARIEKSILYTLANSRTASNEPVPNDYVKDTDLKKLQSVFPSECLAGSAVTGLTDRRAESRRRVKFGRSFAMLIVAFQGYYHNNAKELRIFKVSFGKAMGKERREPGEAAKKWIDTETAAYHIIVWIEVIARTWRDA